MMESYKLYAGGQLHDTESYISVTDPAKGRVFARVCQADPSLVEQVIQDGMNAESAMKEMPVYHRAALLNQIADRIDTHQDELSILVCKESGKPIRYAQGEIQRTIQTYRIAAEECKRIPGEYLSLDWTRAGTGKEAWVKRFPVGLVAGISPFNFPLNLTAHKIAPALAAGNPIILKPSSKTPVSMLRLAELIVDLDIPRGGISIVPMSRRLGDLLVEDTRVKLLSFTGSPSVGWNMKKRAGKKKVILELGGNAGVYVGASADMNQAVNRCLGGAFAYSGQVCIHLQRIYVEQSVHKAFLNQFTSQVSQLQYGPSHEYETDISTMIDEDNAIRVESWVNEAVAEGAQILCGGTRQGGYYPPTVLTNTQLDMKVCSLEVFGPVVSVEAVPDLDEAVQRINYGRYGLQAGVFTNQLDEMDQAFDQLEVGGVVINDVPTFRVDHMPYGGVKDSGFGREGLKYAIEEMTEPKVLIKPKS